MTILRENTLQIQTLWEGEANPQENCPHCHNHFEMIVYSVGPQTYKGCQPNSQPNQDTKHTSTEPSMQSMLNPCLICNTQ
mmetsp:Transcript_3030/g.5827  ORF Transcript_3030/g.5827 Transcript_3030/m.5827 type:complete len:80 (-) Transcript_3030:460-699(-)